MESRYPKMVGLVESNLDLPAVSAMLSKTGFRAEVRESSHYVGGQYVRLYTEPVYVSLERDNDQLYIARGDADTIEEMFTVASKISEVLKAFDVRYSLEIYDPNGTMVHCLR